MPAKKNTNRIDYNDAEKIKAYCENDVAIMNELEDDWKRRLYDEYCELRARYEKLRKHNVEMKINRSINDLGYRPWNIATDDEKKELNKENVRENLLIEQEDIMGSYIHTLEKRMTLEGIDYLTEVMFMASMRRSIKRHKMFKGLNAKQKKLRRQELKRKRQETK